MNHVNERKESRHGKRAEGQVVITFPIPENLKSEVRRISRNDGVTSAEWLRLIVRNAVRRHNAAKKTASV